MRPGQFRARYRRGPSGGLRRPGFNVAVGAVIAALGPVACSSSSNPVTFPTPMSTELTAQVRAVHGSPDAGAVDIYVYPAGTARPGSATVADASYPQITNYLTVAAGTYTVDVLAAGAAATASPVASETVTLAANTQESIVVAGKVANASLAFVNFVEPAEALDQTALIVHHASPYVQSAVHPVGVGVYDASAKPPATVAQLFAFSLVTPSSGPAASGAVAGGEFFLSPLPAGLPAAVGFAAGPPSANNQLTTLITATPSELASSLQNRTSQELTLAADKTSALPTGAHLSIFAVDTTSSAQLIGTLDP